MNDNDKPTHDWTGRRVTLPTGPPTLAEREAPLLARIAELERERDQIRDERDELGRMVDRLRENMAGAIDERDAYRAFAVKIGLMFGASEADDLLVRHMAHGDLDMLTECIEQRLTAGQNQRADLLNDLAAALNSLDLALESLARLAGDSAPALTGPTQLRTNVVRAWVERVEGDIRLLRPEAPPHLDVNAARR